VFVRKDELLEPAVEKLRAHLPDNEFEREKRNGQN
jgi:hypothetical protein